MNGNGQLLRAMQAQAPAQQGPTVIAAPFNDVQLVAMIAAQQHGMTPREAVARALDIVTEAVVQFDGGAALAQKINVRKSE